ncbi:MAG: hypothetical protein OEZ48_03915 [Candidatus Bathyarchaeota archaeon]|nr:hypothetical protein [Candidatus Bathyarchaeota archaeon]MDH5686993.1 hypothetical protein [Candidatus Bathyarchaeota archaeon]
MNTGAEWEIGVSWHVMIQPQDRARIYLRNRYTEATPSYAFELSSYTMEDYTIREVTLEEPSRNRFGADSTIT